VRFAEEARKLALPKKHRDDVSSVEEKRAYFPEDIIDSKFPFHSCLLS
jgi:hypothetical protein